MRSYLNFKHVWLELMMPVFSRVTGVLWISRKYTLRLTEKLRIATHGTMEGIKKRFYLLLCGVLQRGSLTENDCFALHAPLRLT
jgi:hypothetical protein